MSNKNITKTKASDMFFLAVVAYLLTLVAPILGTFVNQDNLVPTLIIRVISVAAWIFGAWGLVKITKKDCGFDILEKGPKPTAIQWVLTSVATVAFIVYCFISGADGYYAILQTLEGPVDYVYLITYYLMNAVQACVVVLIVALAQKGGELALGLGKYIPYGGIALGICWAIAQFFSSFDYISVDVGGTLLSMLWMLVYGIIFGIIYLLIGKKPIYALIFIAPAFVIM